jgi:hypothetical protein
MQLLPAHWLGETLSTTAESFHASPTNASSRLICVSPPYHLRAGRFLMRRPVEPFAAEAFRPATVSSPSHEGNALTRREEKERRWPRTSHANCDH